MLLRLFACLLTLSLVVSASSAWAQNGPPSTKEEVKPDTVTTQPMGDVPVEPGSKAPPPDDRAASGQADDAESNGAGIDGWVTVESEAGAYRVEMPSEPVDTVRVSPTAMGPLDVHMKITDTESIAYLVGYMDVPSRDTTLEETQLLANIVSRLIMRENFKNVSDTSAFRFEGYPGKYLQFMQGDLHMRWAYRAIGMRVYMQGIVADDAIPDGATSYFDSFELTQPADSIAALRTEQPHLDRLLTQIGWEYEVDDDGEYRLILNVDSTRSQAAWIRTVNNDRAGTPSGYEVYAQVMYADAAPSPSFMEAMLRRNGPLYGSFELFENADGEYLVFYSAFTPDVPDADALYTVVADVVTVADEMEKEWIGGDEY